MKKIEDVDIFLHRGRVDEARSFLDFHFGAMVLLGSVKREVAALVIRQINHRYSQLFGGSMTLITPLERQPRHHPFLFQLFKNAVVCSPHYHSRE